MDDVKSTTIEGLTEEYANLKTLSLNNIGLTRLKGFPRLANLKHLELSDNRISGNLEVLLGCPNLTHLNLSGNKIADLDALEPFKDFKHLKSLDLYNNGVNNLPKYREKMFKLIPSLKYLDGTDINDKEADDDSEDSEEGDEGDDDEEDDFIEDDTGTAALVRDDEEDDEDDEDFEAGEEEDEEDDDADDDEEEDADGQEGEAVAKSDGDGESK